MRATSRVVRRSSGRCVQPRGRVLVADRCNSWARVLQCLPRFALDQGQADRLSGNVTVSADRLLYPNRKQANHLPALFRMRADRTFSGMPTPDGVRPVFLVLGIRGVGVAADDVGGMPAELA